MINKKHMSEDGRMKNRIINYYNQIESMLESKSENIDYEEEIRNHLIQINFFMHERIIHLMVTITFAILTMISILYTMMYPSIPMFFLVVLLFVLLIPYIKHYYLLENSIQKMYEQYDEMLKRRGQL